MDTAVELDPRYHTGLFPELFQNLGL